MSEPISWSPGLGSDVCVCGIGARTPLGFNAPSSAAAVRGAISAIAAHPFFVDRVGQPMCVARDTGLALDLRLTRRIEHLLTSALEEATTETIRSFGYARTQCWIGLPEPRIGVSQFGPVAASVVSKALALSPSAIHTIERGHASGLIAIQMAAQKISSGEAEIGVVGAVDSYHDPDTLEWLDGAGLLMSSANRNGFPPGEAAGACVLSSTATAKRLGLPILARVTSASTSIEAQSIRSSGVCIGEGLSAAISNAVSAHALPAEKIAATYCDLNGERYRSEEFTYTILRVQDFFVSAHDYLCPADCWGDVGAASGPLFASLAIEARRREYAKGRFSLLWAGSESGYRSALVLALDEG